MITKAAILVFRNNQGRRELLFVRPKTRSYVVLPGGKQDPNESIDDALERELQEELGVNAKNVSKIGIVAGRTPDGRDIEEHLYTGELAGEPHSQTEIEEIFWLSKEDIAKHSETMTPLTLDHILPFLDTKQLW